MAVNFKDLTDEELKAWDPSYKGKGRGKRRTGKGGPGPGDKAIKGTWNAILEGLTQQHTTEQLIRKGVKTDIGKGVKRLFRGTDRPLTTQQKQRQSLQKSMKQLQKEKLARSAEIARRSKLTPKQQQSEKNQRILSRLPPTVETKKEVGLIPESAPGQKVDNWSLENVERVYGGRFPDIQGAAKSWNSLPKDLQQQQALASFGLAENKPSVITTLPKEGSKPSVIEELTKRERFALGQVRGSVAQNKARAKEIRIEQQKAQLGNNIQQTAGEKFTQTQNNLVNNKELYNKVNMKEGSEIFKKAMNTDVNIPWNKNAESLLKDKESLLGDKKAALPKKTDIKQIAKNLGIETRPWKLILNAMAAIANPNMGDKQLPFDNKMGQMAQNLAREGTEGIPDPFDPYSWA